MPIKYAIGKVDPRFEISKTNFKQAIREATHMWEKWAPRDLFEYDHKATFKINLIYDQRQRASITAKLLEKQLDKLEVSHTAYKVEYDALNKNYKEQSHDFEMALEKYHRRLERYNRRVQFWNQRGGAPEHERKKLKKKQRTLEQDYKKVKQEQQKLEPLIQKINRVVLKINQVTRKYNRHVYSYQAKFGTSRQFNQGDYRGNEINVYHFFDRSDLILILAHELGHALGIDHIQNPKSIMYYLMGDQMLTDLKLTQEDKNAMFRALRKNR